MALKNAAITVSYVAWNAGTGAGQTGDVSNHTLKLIQDGTAASPTNSPSEVDSTNAPGLYKLALTAGDMNFNCVVLCGKSSTANVSIIPLVIVTERGVLPTVAPATSGGFVTLGTGAGQLNVDGAGNAEANVVKIAGTTSAGAAGYVAPDWSAVHAPTSTVALSGTTVAASNFPTNFTSQLINSSGQVSLAGPFKINTAAGFEFAMLTTGGAAYTGGSVTGTREIAGAGTTSVSGTITQIGSTNRYYFAGASADFNGANVTFTFSASGAASITVSINTTP